MGALSTCLLIAGLVILFLFVLPGVGLVTDADTDNPSKVLPLIQSGVAPVFLVRLFSFIEGLSVLILVLGIFGMLRSWWSGVGVVSAALLIASGWILFFTFQADAASHNAAAYIAHNNLEAVLGNLGYGLLGAWTILLGLTARQKKLLPAWVCWAGVAWGAIAIFVAIPTFNFLSPIGLLTGIVWFTLLTWGLASKMQFSPATN